MTYDLFVSYSRRDNGDRVVDALVQALQREHAQATAGSHLSIFFDSAEIRTMDDWKLRIYNALRSSHILLACLSPSYFASEWCRREWQLYVEHERDYGLAGEGIAPIYFVEVPAKESDKCDPLIVDWLRNLGDRQYKVDLRPFFVEGEAAFDREEVQCQLAALDQQIADRLDRAARVGRSPATIPPHNPNFTGRSNKLLELKRSLFGGRFGVVTAVHGLGGVGKSALAFEYGHMTAEDYPGGRWLLPCGGHCDLREALRPLAHMLGIEFTGREESDSEEAFVRLCAEVGRRDRMLLLLDNVDEPKLLSPDLVSRLPAEQVHLLVTTRLAPHEIPGENKVCVDLDELSPDETLRLLGKHRSFDGDDTESAAATQIAILLGGFPLVTEVIGVFLRAESSVNYQGMLRRLQLEGLVAVEAIGRYDNLALSRHREKLLSATLRPSLALLTPTERITLAVAASLLPDSVPVPWLKELLGLELPDAISEPKPGYPDPWLAILRKLDGMRLLTPASDSNVRRMHSMVQFYVTSIDTERDQQRGKIDPMVAARAKRLEDEDSWIFPANRWEIEPIGRWACRDICVFQAPSSNSSIAGSIVNQALQDRALEEAVESLVGQPDACYANRAQMCTSVGRIEEGLCHIYEARWLLRLAIRLWERSVGKEDARLALAYVDLVAFERRFANHPLGLRLEREERVLEALSIATSGKAKEFIPCLTKLGLIAIDQGDLRMARVLFRRAMAIATGKAEDEVSFSRDATALGWPMIEFAANYFLREPENREQARSLIVDLLTTFGAGLGAHRVSLAFGWMATLEKEEGHPAEARSWLVNAIKIQEKLFDPNHVELGENYAVLAAVEEALDNKAEAHKRWIDAARIGTRIWFPWGHLEKWTSWNIKAALSEQASGHLDRARASLEPIITAFNGLITLGSAAAKKDPTLMNTYLVLADIEVQDGRLADAKSCLKKAQSIAIQHYGENHAKTQEIDHQLRTLYE